MAHAFTPRCFLPVALLATSVCGGTGGDDAPERAGRATPGPLDTILAVGSTRLFVHAEGDGPPVLVVHGGPVLDHGYLVPPLRPLADGHRLVFFDQRLSGRSDGTVASAAASSPSSTP